MTPHNNAKKNEIAKTVLMPGDPLRAKWIAENFLNNPKLVNDVRSMNAYTGKYKNKLVTVMAHGMGIPSIGIYSYELFNFYDVNNIIRIGSAGAYARDIHVRDVLVAAEAYSESSYASEIGVVAKDKILKPSKKLLDLAIKQAKSENINLKVVRVDSKDAFYNKYKLNELVKTTGAQAVEMEAFGLYANASLLNKNALCLLTVSDSLATGESLPPDERQTSFKEMVKLALEVAIKIK